MPISTVANIAKEVVLKELSLIKSCLLQLSFSSCYILFFLFSPAANLATDEV